MGEDKTDIAANPFYKPETKVAQTAAKANEFLGVSTESGQTTGGSQEENTPAKQPLTSATEGETPIQS